jgi:sugar/nucleoside kinase (ribokinase family)
VSLRYDAVVGTGGIGTGIFLALEGNRTLGREESRPAELLDQRDSCKLHNVCHYTQRLLGAQVPVLPVGRVGDDDAGRQVLADMRATGLDTALVGMSDRPTLFSVCFLYPDGDGGNLTTSRSASSEVAVADVEAARPAFERHPGRGVALALPEVPLAPRLALLRLATEHGWLRVAALVPDEIEAVRESGLLERVDLLALNIEEAAVLGRSSPQAGVPDVLEALAAELLRLGCRSSLVVTAGGRGSWSWDGHDLSHAPAVDGGAAVVSTAGAGDAHLAGVVVGLVAGADLAAANAFAALVSGLKVRSAHTIHPGLDATAVAGLAERLGRPLTRELRAALDGVRA